MGNKRGERQNAPGALPLKRPSGPAGGLQPGQATPTGGSTQAQFQTSQTNIPQTTRGPSPQVINQHPAHQHRGHQDDEENKKSGWQKMQAVFCCR